MSKNVNSGTAIDHSEGSDSLNVDTTIDVFSFSIGDTLYAIRMAHVLSLSQNIDIVRSMLNCPEAVIGIIDYQANIVPIFDLAMLLNVEANYKQWEALQISLRQRKQDHIDWMDSLEQSIRGGGVFSKAKDPHQCVFGRWYDEFETSNDELRELLIKFDEPHKRIHSLANTLIALSENNQHSEALSILSEERGTTLRLLLELFDRVQNHITALARTVLLFTTTNGKTPLFALKMSEVSDAKSYTKEQFSAGMSESTATDIEVLDGFLSDDNGHVCVLLDVQKIAVYVESLSLEL